MRIKSIESYVVSVPFKKPIRFALGLREGTTRILARVRTDDGLEGWGETHYIHFFDGMIERVLAPALIGEDPRDFERLYARLEAIEFVNYQRSLTGPFSAIEMALWDIWGKALHLPIYRLLGGLFRERIGIVGYVFIGDPEQQAMEAADCVRRGYTTIKLKVGVDENRDVAMVRQARRAIGTDVRLRVDPNQAWTLATAKRILKRVEDCDLEYMEQPIRTDDLIGLAELRKATTTPIAANESAYTLHDVAELIRLRAVDVIVSDPRTAGGLWRTKKMAALCEGASMPITMHSGAELGIATAAYLHWAASTPNAILALDSHGEIQVDDVVRTPLEYGPVMRVPQGPGLGVEVDIDKVREFAARPPYAGMGLSKPLAKAMTIPTY